MSDCCNKPMYYKYTEFLFKSESITALTNNNFAIKLVFDEIDSKGEPVTGGKLVLTSLFESIGIDKYSVITNIVHHLSDKKTSKSTVNHSTATATQEYLDTNTPFIIMSEKSYKNPVTAPLSTTCNGWCESNLIESNKDGTLTTKFFRRRTRVNETPWLRVAAITTSSIDLWSP